MGYALKIERILTYKKLCQFCAKPGAKSVPLRSSAFLEIFFLIKYAVIASIFSGVNGLPVN
jgi:hypothetical protein